MLFKYKSDESNIVPFAKCPACHQLIKLESFVDTVFTNARNCPSCDTFIEKNAIISSYERYLKVTKALQSAVHLTNGNRALFIIFALSLFFMLTIYAGGDELRILVQFGFIYSTAFFILGYWAVHKWLDEFAHLLIDDEEFITAQREIKRSRLIWVTALIFNLLLWFLYIKFF